MSRNKKVNRGYIRPQQAAWYGGWEAETRASIMADAIMEAMELVDKIDELRASNRVVELGSRKAAEFVEAIERLDEAQEAFEASYPGGWKAARAEWVRYVGPRADVAGIARSRAIMDPLW